MSKYVIGIFSTYQDAKEATESLNDRIREAVILNRLQKFEEEDSGPKLDGVISGVSDVFLGLPVFVNPMSAIELPSDPEPFGPAEMQWEQFGFTREEAVRYQDLMQNGKTVLAIKSEEKEEQISNKLKEFHAEEVRIHEF